MTIAIGQFTITDFNDINISSTEPISPVLDMLWLDTSATPYTLKIWNGAAWIASRALSLAELDVIQDAKLNTRITTFYQATVPTSTAVGDFWVDTSNNNHLYRAECIGADEIADGEWVSVRDTSATEALDDFVDAVFTPGVSNLQDQIDGKIETWFQEDDPNTWLEEERSAHNNDRWFKPSTQALKKYIASTNTWETIDDALAISAYIAASTAQDTADGKRRVFTTTPTVPYDVGDLWSEGSEGDLKRCKTAKTGDSYYYYNEGTENIVFDVGYSAGNGSQSKEEDYLSIISQDEGSVRTYVTTSAIDLTHINTLKIDWEGIQLTGSAGFAIVVISDNKTNNYDTFDARKIINFGFARTVTEVDVSSLEGSYYVRVHSIAGFPGDSYQVKVYNIEEVSEYNANDWELATKYDSPLSTTTYIIADYDTSNNIERADYVVPSGSTSAQEVINQAINDLPTDGGKLVLLDGTYVVDNSILVSSNVTLEGQGSNTIIKLKNSIGTVNIISNKNLSLGNTNIKIYNLKIDGNKENQTSGLHNSIYIKNSSFVTINDINIINSYGHSISLELSTNSTVVNNFCYESKGSDIYLYQTKDNLVSGNMCDGNSNGYNGIAVDDSENNIIVSNICNYHSYTGIVIQEAINTVVSNNTANYNGEIGINVNKSTESTIANNTCKYNDQDGIKIYYYSNNNIITGNLCLGNGQKTDNAYQNLIIFYYSDYNNVQNNICRKGSETNKSQYGIAIADSTCNGNIVTNNDLYDSGVSGSLSDGGTGTITTAGNRT